jgi:hypothetical protein
MGVKRKKRKAEAVENKAEQSVAEAEQLLHVGAMGKVI